MLSVAYETLALIDPASAVSTFSTLDPLID